MLTNPEKSNEGKQQMLDAFESLREIHFELKRLHQSLLHETWMPPGYLMQICKSIDQLEQLRDYLIQYVFQPYNNGLILTVPSVCMTELGYAMQANKTFNHGTAPVNKILDALGRMANVNLGNTSRTFQQLLYRKEGPTKYLDSLKTGLNNRINDF